MAHGDEIAATLSRENGKPIHEAWLHELLPLYSAMSWLIDESSEILADRAISLRWLKQYRSTLSSRPRGQCLIISPYNFPLLIPFSDAAAALASGCSVVIKPSEHTPLTALLLAKLASEVGIDPALLQVFPGGPDTARALLEAEIDEVVFTGSLGHGREVARSCAERLIPCTLELGGKASLLAFEDADIELAASAAVFGALANSGQSCIAVERVIVHRRIKAAFLESILNRVRTLRQGNPANLEVDLGALTSSRHIDHLQAQVNSAVADGATLMCGGLRLSGPGNFYAPTILDGCTSRMPVVSEETFGPIIPIVTVDSVGEALALANTGASGLAAYLFGRDESRLHALVPQIRAGHILLNDVLWSYVCPEIPFGGRDQSGFGLVHGPEGLKSHTRPVHVGTKRLRLPEMLGMGFPYSEKTRGFLKHTLRLITR
jgi:acyl-CoA reductase-like NAD-dependent aldehyde dehydrogenase